MEKFITKNGTKGMIIQETNFGSKLTFLLTADVCLRINTSFCDGDEISDLDFDSN